MPAQDLLTGQRIVAPEPKTTDLESSAKEESETTVESGLDKVELPPVPTTEQPAESKTKPAKRNISQEKKDAPKQASAKKAKDPKPQPVPEPPAPPSLPEPPPVTVPEVVEELLPPVLNRQMMFFHLLLLRLLHPPLTPLKIYLRLETDADVPPPGSLAPSPSADVPDPASLPAPLDPFSEPNPINPPGLNPFSENPPVNPFEILRNRLVPALPLLLLLILLIPLLLLWKQTLV